jgi:hypothetical protein
VARRRLLVTLGLVVAGLSIGASASADCAGPEIDVQPRKADVGDKLRIVGSSWGTECNDDEGPGWGCSEPPLGSPEQDIKLQLINEETGATTDLAEVDASEEYTFVLEITIPDVPPGRYTITDARGRSYFPGKPITITAAN